MSNQDPVASGDHSPGVFFQSPSSPGEGGDYFVEEEKENVSQYPIESLVHNLSHEALAEAVNELEAEKTVQTAITEVSSDFVSGRLSLSQYPISEFSHSHVSEHSLTGNGHVTDSALSQHLLTVSTNVGLDDLHRKYAGGQYTLDTPRSVESFTTASESVSRSSSASERPPTSKSESDSNSSSASDRPPTAVDIKSGVVEKSLDSTGLSSSSSLPILLNSRRSSMQSLPPGRPLSSQSSVSTAPQSQEEFWNQDWHSPRDDGTYQPSVNGRISQSSVSTLQGQSSRPSSTSTLPGRASTLSEVSSKSGPSVKRARLEETDKLEFVDKYLKASPGEEQYSQYSNASDTNANMSRAKEFMNQQPGSCSSHVTDDSIVFEDRYTQQPSYISSSFVSKKPMSTSTPYVIGIEDPILQAKLRSPKKDSVDSYIKHGSGPVRADHGIVERIDLPQGEAPGLLSQSDVTKRISWGAESEASAMSADSITSESERKSSEQVPIKSAVKLPIDISMLDKPLQNVMGQQRSSGSSLESEKSVDSDHDSSARLNAISSKVTPSSYILYPPGLRSATPGESRNKSSYSNISKGSDISSVAEEGGMEYLPATDRSKLTCSSLGTPASLLMSSSLSRYSISPKNKSDQTVERMSGSPKRLTALSKASNNTYVSLEEREYLMGFSPEEIEARRMSRALSPQGNKQESPHSSCSEEDLHVETRQTGDGLDNEHPVSQVFTTKSTEPTREPTSSRLTTFTVAPSVKEVGVRSQFVPSSQANYPHRRRTPRSRDIEPMGQEVSEGQRLSGGDQRFDQQLLPCQGESDVNVLKIEHDSHSRGLSGRSTIDSSQAHVRPSQTRSDFITQQDQPSSGSISQTSDVPSLALQELQSEQGSDTYRNDLASARTFEVYGHPQQSGRLSGQAFSCLPATSRTMDTDILLEQDPLSRPSTQSSVYSSQVTVRTSDLDSARTLDSVRTSGGESYSSDVLAILRRYENKNEYIQGLRQRLSPTGSDVSQDSLARRVQDILAKKDEETSVRSKSVKRCSKSPKRLSKSPDRHSLLSSHSTPNDSYDQSMYILQEGDLLNRSSRSQTTRSSLGEGQKLELRSSYEEDHIEESEYKESGFVSAIPRLQRLDSVSSFQSQDSLACRVQTLLEPNSVQTYRPQRKLLDKSSHSVTSEDSLSRKVNALLSETIHLADEDGLANSQQSVDYDALRRDLNEIEESLNLHSFTQLGDRSSTTAGEDSVESGTTGGNTSGSPSGGLMRNKRLAWDHGADLAYSDGQGHFIRTLEEVEDIRRQSLETTRTDMLSGRTEPDGTSGLQNLLSIQPITASRMDPNILHKDFVMDCSEEDHNVDIWTHQTENHARPYCLKEPREQLQEVSSNISDDRSEFETATEPSMDYDLEKRPISQISILSKSEHYGSIDSLARKVSDLLDNGSPKKQVRDILTEAENTEKQVMHLPQLPDRSYVSYPPELKSTSHSEADSVEEEYARLRAASSVITEHQEHAVRGIQHLPPSGGKITSPNMGVRQVSPHEETIHLPSVRELKHTAFDSELKKSDILPTSSMHHTGRGCFDNEHTRAYQPRARLHSSSTPNLLGDRPGDYHFHITPITTGPMTAAIQAKTFLANQLERMARQRFDRSVDLRTPFRHAFDDLEVGRRSHMKTDLKDDVLEHRDNLHVMSKDGFYEASDETGRHRAHSDPLLRQSGYSSDDIHIPSRVAGDLHPRDVLTEFGVKEDPHPDIIADDHVNVHRHGHSHASGSCPYRTSVPSVSDSTISRAGVEIPLPPSSVSTSYQSLPPRSSPTDTAIPSKSASYTHVSPTYTDARNSELQISEASYNRLPVTRHVSRLSGRRSRSPHDMSGVRPYKPRGSSEIYYVDGSIHDQDESNISVLHSETTMESTHTESDDAQGPYIPPHLLGSRKESPDRHSVGIYGSRRKSPDKSPTARLHLKTIEENEIRKEMESLEKTLDLALKHSVQKSAEKTLQQAETGKERIGEYQQKMAPSNAECSRHSLKSDSFTGELHGRPAKSFIEYPSSLKSGRSETFTPLIPDQIDCVEEFPLSASTLPNRQRRSPLTRTHRSPQLSPRATSSRTGSRSSPYRSPPRFLGSRSPVRLHRAEPIERKHAFDLLRETIQNESDVSSVPSDLNQMWDRFNEMMASRSKSAATDGKRVENFRKLMENPVHYFVQKFSQDRQDRLRAAEEVMLINEMEREKAKRRKEQRAKVRFSDQLQKSVETELKLSSDKKQSKFVEVDRDNEIERQARQIIKEGKKFNHMHGDDDISSTATFESTPIDRLDKGKLVSMFKHKSAVPAEDTSVDSLSSSLSDMSLESEKLYRVFDPRKHRDPKYAKLQRLIQKQKQGHNKLKMKQLRKQEKIKNLEKLLSSKKQDGDNSLSSISTTSTVTTSDDTTLTLTDYDSSHHIMTSTLTPVPEVSISDQSTIVETKEEKTGKKYSKSKVNNTKKADSQVILTNHDSASSDMTDASICACCKTDKSKHEKSTKSKHEKLVKEIYKKDSAYIEFKKPTHKTRASSKAAKSPSRKSNSHTRDVAIMYPSPLLISPAEQRSTKSRKVMMVSEAVQTTPRLGSNSVPLNNNRGFVSIPVSSAEKNKNRDYGVSAMFQPESLIPESLHNRSPERKYDVKPQSRPSPGGQAWYVPMNEVKPWRQPLKERQTNAIRHESWPATKKHNPRWLTKENVAPLPLEGKDKPLIVLSKCNLRSSYGNDNVPKPLEKLSLQEAFQLAKQDFISCSKKRVRRVALAADERYIQAQHLEEREKLFADMRKKMANPDAHPYSENLHKPRRRTISKREMRERSKKVYYNLPEVKQDIARKRVQQEYKANRLRAQMFKYKVLNKVLGKA